MTDAAEVSVPEGYDEQDYLKMYAFLEMADADGVKNGTKLNEDYDPTDPTHLGVPPTRTTTPRIPRPGVPAKNITWRELTTGEGEDEVTVRYLLIFNAPASDLCGQLDLSGCKFLREVYVQNNTPDPGGCFRICNSAAGLQRQPADRAERIRLRFSHEPGVWQQPAHCPGACGL